MHDSAVIAINFFSTANYIQLHLQRLRLFGTELSARRNSSRNGAYGEKMTLECGLRWGWEEKHLVEAYTLEASCLRCSRMRWRKPCFNHFDATTTTATTQKPVATTNKAIRKSYWNRKPSSPEAEKHSTTRPLLSRYFSLWAPRLRGPPTMYARSLALCTKSTYIHRTTPVHNSHPFLRAHQRVLGTHHRAAVESPGSIVGTLDCRYFGMSASIVATCSDWMCAPCASHKTPQIA